VDDRGIDWDAVVADVEARLADLHRLVEVCMLEEMLAATPDVDMR
jgi:hypothetical protein